MKIYHTSPEKIKNITMSGKFGDCLFFSSSIYVMAGCDFITYEMNVNDDFIHVSQLFYHDNCDNLNVLVKDVQDTYSRYFDEEIDEEEAQEYIDTSLLIHDKYFDLEDAAEFDWYLQGVQGQCAKALNFVGVESEDEQGTVYIIPMSDKLHLLKEIA